MKTRLTQPLKWHGGKHYLAKRIIALMPDHLRYLEPYAGGLSVLLAKPCDGIAEWANDTNGDITNFWRVLAETPDRMLRALWGTPLSQAAFVEAKAYLDTDGRGDRVRRATKFFIAARQSRQALMKEYCTPTLNRTRRGMNEQVSAWLSAIDGLQDVHERIRRVEIWNRPALDAIRVLDGEDLLVYADPPYMHEARSSKSAYGEHEMSPEQHAAMLDALAAMQGKFLLSGYRTPMYDQWANLHGIKRVDFTVPNHASNAKKKERKIESVWMNY